MAAEKTKTKGWLYCICAIVAASVVYSLPVDTSPTFPCLQTRVGNKQIILECTVNQGQYLDYAQIRQMTRLRTTGEKFKVTISCNGGKIYLPWPFRASNVIDLKVQGCQIEGFLSEAFEPQVEPDELKSILISDVTYDVSMTHLYNSLVNLGNMTKEFQCGPTKAEEMIIRNVMYNFSPGQDFTSELLLMEQLMSGSALQLLATHKGDCAYPFLKHLEESGQKSLSLLHFKLFQENKYPNLKTYSLRNNSFGRIPNELRDLRFSFLPSLNKLDLSYNSIEEVDFVLPEVVPSYTKRIHVDMRYNNIRTISGPLVTQLAKSKHVTLDLRHNPLMCSCTLYKYALYLAEISPAYPDVDKYRDLYCFSADSGQSQHSLLDVQFGRTLCREH